MVWNASALVVGGRTRKMQSLFVVSFPCSTDGTVEEQHAEYNAKVKEVERFLESQWKYVTQYRFVQFRYLHSGISSSLTRRKQSKLLYEVPFVEAIFEFTSETDMEDTLPCLYTEWCKDPPIEAWINRGSDISIFDGKIEWRTRTTLNIEKAQFGIIDGLSTFCPEYTVKAKRSTIYIPENIVKLEATFDHTHSQLNLAITHKHSCEENLDQFRKYRLEIKYKSIARVIVELQDTTEIYMRLTNPGALFIYDGERDPRSVYRTNNMGCKNRNCSMGFTNLRRLGGANVLKLRLPDQQLSLLHRLFSRLHRTTNFVAKVNSIKRPHNDKIKAVRGHLTDDLYPRIPFRAAYAIDSCRLISLDLCRQMAIMSNDEMKEFCSQLEAQAHKDGKMFERAMFEITQAIDEGNVIIYRRAVNDVLNKLHRQDRLEKEKGIDHVKDEPLVKGMRVVYKVYVTPSRTILRPPAEHGDNRILREVDPDRMLRVAFLDDDQCPLTHGCVGPFGREFLRQTVYFFLEEGVRLVGRTYEYLAASSSQLREHGCWMYSEDSEGRTAHTIRKSMGNFDNIKYVGKKMAREGQCFSSTTETVKVSNDELEIIDDIKGGMHESSRKPYTFSDGVGKISPELRDDVCNALKDTLKNKIPCAFQIRYRGAKGMVAVDPNLKGRRLVLRKSMVKFECDTSDSFEVIKVSEERNVTLNRQIITILEQMGVKTNVFLHYQERNILDFTDALLMESAAAARLQSYIRDDQEDAFALNFRDFRDNHMSIIRDPYFRSMLLTLYNSILSNLRSKSRIAIPWTLGRNLLGVMDETGTLEYGEVYVQYTVREDVSDEDYYNRITKRGANPSKRNRDNVAEDDEHSETKLKGTTKVLTGPVVVTKCPCVAPGDVRMFTAIDVPQLAHLKDVIVFPAKGPRPHSNEMAGSDLDGDEYAVIWDERFFFKCQCEECKNRRNGAEENPSTSRRAVLYNHPAMNFSDEPPKEKNNISLKDYYEFFCDYIMTDQVGRVSNAHLASADQEPEGIFSEKCDRLARKLSTCLDFAKTGHKDNCGVSDFVKRYPDFMEKQSHKKTYRSNRALGHLFRSCRVLEGSFNLSSMGSDDKYVNELFLLPGWDKMAEPARRLVMLYDQRLRKVLEQAGIVSEPELMTGLITHFDKYQSKNFHEVEERQEQLAAQRSYLCRRMTEDFDKCVENALSDTDRDNEEKRTETQLYLASACYAVVYNPKPTDPKTEFKGLPWIFSPYLMRCLEMTRAMYPSAFDPIPDSPITVKITDAIVRKIQREAPDLQDQGSFMHVYITLVSWAEIEDLHRRIRDEANAPNCPLICAKCLKILYLASRRSSMFDEHYDGLMGSEVLLFMRYCAMEFESKTSVEKLGFGDCTSMCGMRRNDTIIRQRITMAAMKTYSRLAVSGDVCSIAGLSCEFEHNKTLNYAAPQREGSPMVLCIEKEYSRRLFYENMSEVQDILKDWCGADSPEDHLSLIFKDSRDRTQVAVVLVARDLAHCRLEEKLYGYENEDALIADVQNELKKRRQSRVDMLDNHK
ncbi:uncharacterized protein LOC111249053 isoform X2 [Varroa destructor]|uniref:RNA-directed RNA polymerase n=1 Tax=Varroa destructor TaxID=109461 RepID=A0A7M7JWE9_VARDE|nr:uncharacterized protein LOC111249053 isoform X2 [Varroa destructor]